MARKERHPKGRPSPDGGREARRPLRFLIDGDGFGASGEHPRGDFHRSWETIEGQRVLAVSCPGAAAVQPLLFRVAKVAIWSIEEFMAACVGGTRPPVRLGFVGYCNHTEIVEVRFGCMLEAIGHLLPEVVEGACRNVFRGVRVQCYCVSDPASDAAYRAGQIAPGEFPKVLHEIVMASLTPKIRGG